MSAPLDIGGAVSERDVQVGGAVRLRARLWGDADHPPCVLVHGLTSNRHIWDRVAPRLALAGNHAVTYDQRGHGDSDRPDWGYDFPTQVADLATLLERLEVRSPAVVVGHSWGGSLALEFAARRPALVRGLVLVDGGFFDFEHMQGVTWPEIREFLHPPPLNELTRQELYDLVRSGPLGSIWGEGTEAVFEATFEEDERGYMRRRLSLSNHLAILDAMGAQDYDGAYRALRCPALFIPCHGDPAEQSPEDLMGENMRRTTIERALAVLPRAAVRPFQPAIHDLPQQQPEALAALIAGMAKGELPQEISSPA